MITQWETRLEKTEYKIIQLNWNANRPSALQILNELYYTAEWERLFGLNPKERLLLHALLKETQNRMIQEHWKQQNKPETNFNKMESGVR